VLGVTLVLGAPRMLGAARHLLAGLLLAAIATVAAVGFLLGGSAGFRVLGVLGVACMPLVRRVVGLRGLDGRCCSQRCSKDDGKHDRNS